VAKTGRSHWKIKKREWVYEEIKVRNKRRNHLNI